MKKLILTFVAGSALCAALPAMAGPDWQAIAPCALPPLVLQLDHGPRAQTTPYQNQLRKERHAAQQAACEQAEDASRAGQQVTPLVQTS